MTTNLVLSAWAVLVGCFAGRHWRWLVWVWIVGSDNEKEDEGLVFDSAIKGGEDVS
jgi:hypothetical protein